MLGTFRMSNVITSISKVNKALMQDGLEANIGLSILERFTPIFDYKHNKLILEKNEKFLSAFTFNRSGIILNPKKMNDNFLIAGIIPSSPAKEKGLATGDKIISINGKKVTAITTATIDDLINGKTGNLLNLVLLRNGKEVYALLKLREII
jgi:C-terminal processing protease CtpA/Prc